jgi:prepilin-type processing-associated H-X9-DG protein
MRGPAIIESEITTIVVEPGVHFLRHSTGTVYLFWDGQGGMANPATAGAASART